MRYRACVCIGNFLCFLLLPSIAMGGETLSPVKGQPKGPPALARQTGPPAQKINAPPLKMIEKGVYEIGGVRIIKKEGRVEFPATVNMDKGLLEYLIVGDLGKLHESLLSTEVEPYSLQISLLMLGLEGSTNPLAGQGDSRKPEGDPVSILVRWGNADKFREVRLEDWVILNKKPLDKINWVFTGSVVSNGVFLAQAERSIVAVFHDPVAIIDNTMAEGTSDEIWFVNEKKVPPAGTSVTVVIQKEKK